MGLLSRFSCPASINSVGPPPRFGCPASMVQLPCLQVIFTGLAFRWACLHLRCRRIWLSNLCSIKYHCHVQILSDLVCLFLRLQSHLCPPLKHHIESHAVIILSNFYSQANILLTILYPPAAGRYQPPYD